jgi:hypothetical protein
VLLCQVNTFLRHCRIPPTLTASLAFRPEGIVKVSTSNTNEQNVVGQLSVSLSSYGEGWAVSSSTSVSAHDAGIPVRSGTSKAKAKSSAAPAASESQGATLPTLKASVTYVPMNEVCSEDLCAGRVVLLDAIGDYLDRLLAAAGFGCRAVVLAVHDSTLFKPLGLTKLKAAAEPSDPAVVDLGGEGGDGSSSAGRFDDGSDTAPRIPRDFPKLGVPVVCVTNADATWMRNAIGVPHDLDPDILVPQMYSSRLKSLGYSAELCARALQRGKYDYDSALAWLESNAKFFVEQSSVMAELDAVVAAKAMEAKTQPVVEAAASAAPLRSVTFAPFHSTSAQVGTHTSGGHAQTLLDGEGSAFEASTTAAELLEQDECWPLATRWQTAFRNSSVVISDRYDLTSVTSGGGLSSTSQDQQWLSVSEASTLRQSSLTGLLRTWVAVQFELTVTYSRRAFVRSVVIPVVGFFVCSLQSILVCSAFMNVPPERMPCDPTGIQQLTMMVNAGLNIPRYSASEVAGSPSFDAHLVRVLSEPHSSATHTFGESLTAICSESLQRIVVDRVSGTSHDSSKAEREYCTQKPFFSGGIHTFSVSFVSGFRLRFDVRFSQML